VLRLRLFQCQYIGGKGKAPRTPAGASGTALMMPGFQSQSLCDNTYVMTCVTNINDLLEGHQP